MKKTPTLHSFMYAGRSFSYFLERKAVKNMNLRIHSDGKIYVSVPHWVSMDQIDYFLLEKGEFILRALARIEEYHQKELPPLQYCSGETFHLLGRSISLHISCGEEQVSLQENQLFLTLKDTGNTERKRQLFEQFWRIQCEKTFQAMVREVFPYFEPYGVTFPQIRIKTMRSRWGSCTPKKGIITLNTQLLKYPPLCIKSVITHEFCHFMQPNHSRDFYQLLEHFMPDWKKYDLYLKQIL